MSAYQTQIRAGCFPIRLKPVTQIVLPCLPQGDIRGTGQSRFPHRSIGLGFVYKACPHLGCKRSREPLTRSSYILADSLARCVTIGYGVAHIRASSVSPICAFTDLNTRIFGGFSMAHLATSLRPKIGFCDLIAILAQSLHIRHHLVRPYIHRILYTEIQGDASVSFAQNGLLSCRPQIRFLPGAPAGNAGSYIVAAACFFAFRLCR